MKEKKNQPLLVLQIVTFLAVKSCFQFTGNYSDFRQAHEAQVVEESQHW